MKASRKRWAEQTDFSFPVFTGVLSEEVSGQCYEWVLGNGVPYSEGTWRALVWTKFWKDSRNTLRGSGLLLCAFCFLAAPSGLPAAIRVGQSRTLWEGSEYPLLMQPAGLGRRTGTASAYAQAQAKPSWVQIGIWAKFVGHSVLRLKSWQSTGTCYTASVRPGCPPCLGHSWFSFAFLCGYLPCILFYWFIPLGDPQTPVVSFFLF